MKCLGFFNILYQSLSSNLSQPSIHQSISHKISDSPPNFFSHFLSIVFFSGSLLLHVLHEEGRHGIGVQRVERPQHRRVALAPLQAPQLRQVAQRLRQAAAVGPRPLRAVGPGEPTSWERPAGAPPLGGGFDSLGIIWKMWEIIMEKLMGIYGYLVDLTPKCLVLLHLFPLQTKSNES